jgi:Cu-Zn family superoxide dismutase
MKRLMFVVLLAACGTRTSDPSPGARAEFIDGAGNTVGSATLHAETGGIRIRTRLELPGGGARGFHVHRVGKCEPPFESASSHFNPADRKHGTLNPDGPHAGDMANVPDAGTRGTLVETLVSNVTLDQLLDGDGSALVVHANPDDYRTDPSGNSGARVACAVIRRP